jgi:hypothetical protein
MAKLSFGWSKTTVEWTNLRWWFYIRVGQFPVPVSVPGPLRLTEFLADTGVATQPPAWCDSSSRGDKDARQKETRQAGTGSLRDSTPAPRRNAGLRKLLKRRSIHSFLTYFVISPLFLIFFVFSFPLSILQIFHSFFTATFCLSLPLVFQSSRSSLIYVSTHLFTNSLQQSFTTSR